MATFGKRVQPKHRADPADRKRSTAPAPRSGGAHAAPIAPEVTPPEPAPPAPPGVVPASAAPERPATHSSEPAAAPVSVVQEAPPATATDTLRVLIVDDNEDVRGLLRIAFGRAGIDVVGAASDFREALALAQHDQPQVVLLDVNLPEVPGLDVLPQILERCPQTRVVMFSAQCSPNVIETATARGAVGFIEKGVSMKTVIYHLHQVARARDGEVVQPFPLRVNA